MDTDASSNKELQRLEDAAARAGRTYEQSRLRIAKEWARIVSVAWHEHGVVVSDGNRSRLEFLVANTLPTLRADREQARVRYDAATAQLESLKASIAAEAMAAEANRAKLARLWAQKREVLRDIDTLTQRSRIDVALLEAATRRNIKGLVHFTRIDALSHLPKYGLLSRLACGALGVPCTENDDERFDHLLDHISLSISWPNWQLFYRFRKSTSTTDEAWCVLVLHPNVIWTLDCIFTAENAASSRESHLSIEDRQGVSGFARLFDDSGVAGLGLTRTQLGIPDHMPTSHQAEVLARRCVPWNRVLRIVVSTSGAKRRACAVLPASAHPLLKVNSDPFDRRCDWRQWLDARESRTEFGTSNAPFGAPPSSAEGDLDAPFGTAAGFTD